MNSLARVIFSVATCAVISGVCVADSTENSIKFAPPPFAMTNLTVNDAVQSESIDFMSLKSTGISLNALNFGFGRMAKGWETGGTSIGFSEQLIMGSIDAGGSDASLFGMGIGMPFNIIFDPMSHSGDDNSLPMYFGPHVNAMMISGSFEYQYTYIDYVWNGTFNQPVVRTKTTTASIMVSSFNMGWHMGIQYGLNLGDAVKIIPYIDISQDIVALSAFSMYGLGLSSSSSSNIGPLPVTMMPGFDIVLRQLGLSLGGAAQTMKQPGGDMKQFNLHLRFTQKFRSICGL